jgi:hypothetical protein
MFPHAPTRLPGPDGGFHGSSRAPLPLGSLHSRFQAARAGESQDAAHRCHHLRPRRRRFRGGKTGRARSPGRDAGRWRLRREGPDRPDQRLRHALGRRRPGHHRGHRARGHSPAESERRGRHRGAGETTRCAARNRGHDDLGDDGNPAGHPQCRRHRRRYPHGGFRDGNERSFEGTGKPDARRGDGITADVPAGRPRPRARLRRWRLQCLSGRRGPQGGMHRRARSGLRRQDADPPGADRHHQRRLRPVPDEIDLARRQIAAYEEALREGQGVAVVDGKIVENLHVDTARATLAKAEAIASVEAA